MENVKDLPVAKKTGKKVRRMIASICAVASALSFTSMVVNALEIKRDEGLDANAGMEKIIGILLQICFYAGIALAIYGVYEIVMSFMQNQPEAKTKGIFMTMAGILLTGLQGIVQLFIDGGSTGGGSGG